MTTLSTVTMPFNFRTSLQRWVLQDERSGYAPGCEYCPIKEKAKSFVFTNQQAARYYSAYGGVKPNEVHGWALTAYAWMNPGVSYQDAIKNADNLSPEQCLEFIIADHVGWLEFIAESTGDEVFVNFDTQSLDIWVSKTPEAHCFAQAEKQDSIATIADKLRSCLPKHMIRYLVGDKRAVLPRTKKTLPQVKVESTAPAVGATPEPIAPTATKIDKKLDTVFGERVKQYQQFLIIREELAAIGIKVGKLIKSRDDAKGWNLNWNGDKAGLFWSAGGDWCVESLKYDTELIGQWEGFDLIEHLECNGIDLNPSDED